VNDNPDARESVMDAQSVDPRTGLAKDRTSFAKFRTQLALDRTTLAWIRTALTMATFGFGTVGFFRSLRLASPSLESVQLHTSAIRFGVGLIVLGVAATVLSGIAHWSALKRLRRDEAPVLARWPLSITVAMLLAVVGLLSLWDLLSR
jgi:putative membrane protein